MRNMVGKVCARMYISAVEKCEVKICKNIGCHTMDKVFWALPLLFILTQEGLLTSTSTAGPSTSSSTSCQGESKNIHFKLTSKDPDATIEIQKLIVSEKNGVKEVDEYIIDLTEKRVFLF